MAALKALSEIGIDAGELQGMLNLCGSKESVVALLARRYNIPAAALAPTVMQWFATLPPVPPPSRQRSAPPTLAPPRLALNAGRAPTKAPPCSAPVESAASVMAAISSLNSRLNRSASQANSQQRKSAAPRTDWLGVAPSLRLLPPSVPEDGPLVSPSMPETAQPAHAGIRDEVHRCDMDSLLRGDVLEQKIRCSADDDDERLALMAYMERYACVHGGGALAAPIGTARSGGWNYR